jgi:electron transfer flavoprotein beta subunit
MKILVCISRTPDTTAKIAFGDNNTKFVTDGVQWIINPYDEWYALVRAIMQKEKDPTTVIHLVTVGGADVEPIIRKALALGGDEALRVDLEPMDSYQVAAQIARVAREGQYDVVLTGKETIDSNGSAVGPMVAELLDMDMVSLATGLEFEGSSAVVTREIEGGEEVSVVPLPLVISCQKGMAEARIPNMRGIMAARTKPLKVVAPADATALTKLIAYELPPARSGVKLVPADQPEELVRLLREEARII